MFKVSSTVSPHPVQIVSQASEFYHPPFTAPLFEGKNSTEGVPLRGMSNNDPERMSENWRRQRL